MPVIELMPSGMRQMLPPAAITRRIWRRACASGVKFFLGITCMAGSSRLVGKRKNSL